MGKKKNGADRGEAALWAWFQRKSTELQALTRNPVTGNIKLYLELISRMEKAAGGVHPELTVEDDTCVLVLSVGGSKEAMPDLDRLSASFPPTPGWKIQRFRKPMSGFTTVYEGLPVDGSVVRVGYQVDREADLVHLLLVMPGYKADDDRYKAAGFLALDHGIGGYNTMMHIGQVDFADLAQMRPDAPLVTLEELLAVIEREFY